MYKRKINNLKKYTTTKLFKPHSHPRQLNFSLVTAATPKVLQLDQYVIENAINIQKSPRNKFRFYSLSMIFWAWEVGKLVCSERHVKMDSINMTILVMVSHFKREIGLLVKIKSCHAVQIQKQKAPSFSVQHVFQQVENEDACLMFSFNKVMVRFRLWSAAAISWRTVFTQMVISVERCRLSIASLAPHGFFFF